MVVLDVGADVFVEQGELGGIVRSKSNVIHGLSLWAHLSKDPLPGES